LRGKLSDRSKLTVKYYEELLQKHGTGPKALGYNRDSQAIRFAHVVRDLDLEGAQVLDIGCGYGAFYQYLRGSGVQFDSYRGIDLVEAFIEEAALDRVAPDAIFEVLDFFDLPSKPICDYSFAFGTFCSKTGGSDDDFLRAATEKMFALSRKGLVVTLNSITADIRNDSTVYTDPSFALELAFSLSRNVSLTHSTFPFEFALFIGKEQRFDEVSLAFQDRIAAE